MVKSTQPVYSWRNGRQRQSHIILWFKPCPVLILQVSQCRKTALTQVGSWKGQKTPHCFCSKLWKFCLATYPELKSYEITQHLLHLLNRLGIQENVMRLHMPQ